MTSGLANSDASQTARILTFTQETLLLFLLALFTAAAPAQTTRYVTDQFKLEVRSGPSTGHRIVQMLESGTSVTIMETSKGYSRVQVAGGGQGWILDRYLMDEPAARTQLEAALSEMNRIRVENETLRNELAELRSAGLNATSAQNQLQQGNQQLSSEPATSSPGEAQARTQLLTESSHRDTRHAQSQLVSPETTEDYVERQGVLFAEGRPFFGQKSIPELTYILETQDKCEYILIFEENMGLTNIERIGTNFALNMGQNYRAKGKLTYPGADSDCDDPDENARVKMLVYHLEKI